MKYDRFPLFIGLLMFFSACKTTQVYKPMNAVFAPTSMAAHNLEETLGDEIVLYYSLAALDKDGTVISVNNGVWGVENVYSTGNLYGFSPIDVQVPPKGQMVVSLCLIEVDNYDKAIQYVNQSKDVVNVAKYAARAFRVSGRNLQALRMIGRTLGIAGVILAIGNYLDDDDVLGQYCSKFDHQDLKNMAAKRNQTGRLSAMGQNLWELYHYTIDYRLDVVELQNAGDYIERTPKRGQVLAPTVLLNFDPLVYPKALSSTWQGKPDQLFEDKDGNTATKEWSDGLTNRAFSAQLGLPISPGFRLGGSAKGKFYATAGFHRRSFSLAEDLDFVVGSSYVSSPGATAYFPLKNNGGVELEHAVYALGGIWKIIFNKIYFDLGGGMFQNSANLYFTEGNNHFDGGVILKDPKIASVVEKDYSPYASFRLGLGKYRRRAGVHFTAGILAHKSGLKPSSGYQIFQALPNAGYKPAGLGGPEWSTQFSIGIGVGF